MLPWFGGEDPVRTAGNEEQASSVARARGWNPGRDQKSPLRRCFKPRPPWRTRCAGFASGCQSSVRSCKRSQTLVSLDASSARQFNLTSCPTRRLGDLTPGGCPASCPDAHRPTHGHRHVRIWAKMEISGFRILRKKKSTRVQKFFHQSDRNGFEMINQERFQLARSSHAVREGRARRQLDVVNGSTRTALRTKAIITTRPMMKKASWKA